MSFLSTGDVALMRSEFETSLPETVVIQRATFTSDWLGGSIPSWAAVGTVSARVDPIRRFGEEEAAQGREIGVSAWVVVMAHDESVTASDRIVHQGRTLQITEVRTPQSWQLLTRCECVGLS